MQFLKDKREARRQRAADTTLDQFFHQVMPNQPSLPLPESPVPQFLRSNEAPNDSQSDFIRKSIVMARRAKSQMEEQRLVVLNEPSAHSSLLAAINHRISRAESYIYQHESILSSVRRLPFEILLEIFHHCVVPTSWSTAFDKHAHAPPWYLGQICTSWRMAALAAPALWTTVLSPSIMSTYHTISKQLKALEEQLRRSGASRLSISIEAGNTLWSNQSAIVDALVRHSEKWGTLNFKAGIKGLVFLRGVKNRIPLLTTLKIWTLGREPSVSGMNFTMFEQAPLLQSISLHGLGTSEIVLPFRQIVDYREGIIGSSNSLSITPNARSSAVAFTNLTTLYTFRLLLSAPLLLSKLTQLVVICRTPHPPNVRYLVLPSIESIRISTHVHILDQMIQVMSRSRDARQDGCCPLKRLFYRVKTSDEPEGLITQLLQKTPHLTSLDIPLPPKFDVERIAVGRLSKTLTLLPQLQSCRFHISGSHVFRSVSVKSDLELLCPLADGEKAQNSTSSLPFVHLSLCFSAAEYGSVLNVTLNEYQATSGFFKPLSLKGTLIHQIPLLCDETAPIKLNQTVDHNTEVFETIREIMAYEFREENAADMYHSGLHIVLKRLADLDTDGPGLLASNARNILKQWNTILEKSLHLRRWVSSGPNEMVYIPLSHPIRTSDKALDIVYGIPESGLLVNIPENPDFIFNFVDSEP
ncbi:hypothetical protein CPB83DRAFT_898856 [Crepidotus variabilis]|uniref:F-box domain-containing protein n=1 Tax=Crepidotus variabilis TaxID=179855 RepID=A0A9P6E688_9AGAR|nr:hypothetical protein CPB83DRAFT_898856 [Crepidotus variabilis]